MLPFCIGIVSPAPNLESMLGITRVASGDVMAWVPQAFTALAAQRPLHAIGTRGLPWLEIDFPEDYRRALDQVLPQIERDLQSPRIARSA